MCITKVRVCMISQNEEWYLVHASTSSRLSIQLLRINSLLQYTVVINSKKIIWPDNFGEIYLFAFRNMESKQNKDNSQSHRNHKNWKIHSLLKFHNSRDKAWQMIHSSFWIAPTHNQYLLWYQHARGISSLHLVPHLHQTRRNQLSVHKNVHPYCQIGRYCLRTELHRRSS